ncbi:MAG TPA: DUF1707 domain-containing protein [Mycobacterium sp.]|nr:DUF1707 domain-containing protein [Mycobacterium sp.]
MVTGRTPDTRAKDSDRIETCQVLDSALAEGQLSMAEHQQRVSAATNASTLGDLQSLVADLQQTNALQPPVGRSAALRRPVLLAAIAGAAVVLVGAIAWALMSTSGSATDTTSAKQSAQPSETHALAVESSAKAETPSSTPEDVPPVVLPPPGQLHTAEGMARVIDAMRKRFGDTMGYELAITPDDATLARPDPADDRSKLIYFYRGGWGDPSGRPKSDTDDLTDLAAFDMPAAVAALQAAPETLKIAPADVSDTFIDIDHVADPAGPGALELLVKITTKSGADGFIYLDGASNIKRVEYPS